MGETPPTWFSLVPYLRNLPPYVAGALLVCVVLTVVSLLVHRSLRRRVSPIPEDTLTLANVAEMLMEFLAGLADDVIGHNGRKYLPLIASIFTYILVCNILGLIPGFSPPTMNINTNLACAITVFLAYNYYGFREHGVKYINQFLGPLLPMAVIFLPVELFSQAFRPVTLSVRLFANMFADHNVIEAFGHLSRIVVPVPFMFLGLFVALVQAFVFALLAAVYISLAVSHEH